MKRARVTVLHLVGSAQNQFYADLSLLYARGALDALDYPAVLAYVEPGGTWRFPRDLSEEGIGAADVVGAGEAVARLAGLGAGVALPQMFCAAGMTAYRGLLEVVGIPYVGNGPGVMALTADKARTRSVVAAAGVAVPEGELLRPGERPRLAPPVVVKPVDADNSFGTTVVRDRADYPRALAAAFEHSPAALVERFVPLGREVRCGVLERGGELVCLPLEEYAIDAGRGIRAHADKLVAGGGRGLGFAAKDPSRSWIVDPGDPVTGAVHAAARRSHRALGCRHYGLFDFRIDPAGRPFFLEAGLYCSFSPSSVLATMAAAAGTALDDLFTAFLGEAR